MSHSTRMHTCPKRTGVLVTALAIHVCTLLSTPAQATENSRPASFNTAFLAGPDGSTIDTSRFEHGNPVDAGSYKLDVYVNHTWRGRQTVDIKSDNQTVVCFKKAQLPSLGLDLKKLALKHAKAESPDEGECFDIAREVPSSSLDLNQADLRLDLGIPQAYMSEQSSGYVEPDEWDHGITAAFVDYNTNVDRRTSAGLVQDRYYAGINTGFNMLGWRLRHNGSYSQNHTKNHSGTRRYDALSTFVQRDITHLKSQLTIGEYFSSGELFDSFPYTGIELSSDERMLPDSQRGFAPTIRGIAESNAKVTVRQSNNILYEVNVAPGPFSIDNIHSGGYSGDLEVTVTEADGRTRSFTVPYANVAQLLRPGVSRYSLTTGKYREDHITDAPYFIQGTYQRGISNLWTGYTGSILAKDYAAIQGGLALSTTLGAFALDVTHSRADDLSPYRHLRRESSGESYRLSYSKLLETTQTNFAVAAYRFSSEGYLSFADFSTLKTRHDPSHDYERWPERNRLQLNISQPLGDKRGSLYMSGSTQNYWSRHKNNRSSFNAGYSNSFTWGSFNLSASRSYTQGGQSDTQYMLSISLPLGGLSHTPYLNSSLTTNRDGDTNGQLSVGGSLGSSNQISYNVYGTRSRSNNQYSSATGAQVQYRAPQTNMSASVSNGDSYHQYGLGFSGSAIAHSGGISFSGAQGETRAILEAKGASGAGLHNTSSAKVDRNGYGIVSSLTPYRDNQIGIDPKGLADDVELKMTSQSVAPRYGAVVLLKYPTVTGEPLMLRLQDEDGRSLPVGAEVLDNEGNSLALVGQGSLVFLRSNGSGELQIRWGRENYQQCHVQYHFDPTKVARTHKAFRHASAICVRHPTSELTAR